MPFPLPVDPTYRKELISDWLIDVEDRLIDYPETAEESWQIARTLYLSLPPGEGDDNLEAQLISIRVKIDKINHKP